MGFRFRKRIKLFPVLWLNASKSGISASIGGHGATLTVNRKGVQVTAGLPGSGVSYRTKRRKIGTSARPLNQRIRKLVRLGHTSQDLIFRHYQELVKPEQAEKYWNIRPETGTSLASMVA
jgi:hypothetical protein